MLLYLEGLPALLVLVGDGVLELVLFVVGLVGMVVLVTFDVLGGDGRDIMDMGYWIERNKGGETLLVVLLSVLLLGFLVLVFLSSQHAVQIELYSTTVGVCG